MTPCARRLQTSRRFPSPSSLRLRRFCTAANSTNGNASGVHLAKSRHRFGTRSVLTTARSLVACATLLAYALPVQAQNVTNLTGEIEIAALPPSLLNGAFPDQNKIRLLHEGPGLVTSGMPAFLYDGARHDPNLPVFPGDNTFGYAITDAYAGPGLPVPDTQVYSVLLHFDPNLSSVVPFSLTQGIARSGSITFDQQILGIYVTSQALSATDAIFGPAGVTYATTDAGRDLEFNYDGDDYSISPDRRTLSLTMFGHNGGRFDEARIILAMEPTSVPALPGVGLVVLAALLAALGIGSTRRSV